MAELISAKYLPASEAVNVRRLCLEGACVSFGEDGGLSAGQAYG